MDQETFRQRFVAAYQQATEFGQTFVVETLPDRVLFNLQLNSSYDVNASPEFELFPDDSNLRTTIQTKGIGEEAVVEILYRNGMVPQWVDLQVAGKTKDATIVSIRSCGRFTDDESWLYHQGEGRPPFHVTGPTLPVDYESGELFSIFTRSECWTLSELEYLTQVNAKPWSLTLCGPEFSDDLSNELLDLDTVEILELEATSIAGKLLKSIAFMPKLRVLRIAGANAEQRKFDLTYLPVNHSSLTSFSFRGIPSSVLGSCLRKSFPKMTELILAGSQRVQWSEPPVLTGLERLSVSFPDFATWIGSIEGTESVSLAFDSCSNEQVFDVLSTGQATLKYVTLRGTPVDEEVFKVLNDMPRLKHIDVVDTKVSREALQKFIGKRPELTCWPKLT